MDSRLAIPSFSEKLEEIIDLVDTVSEARCSSSEAILRLGAVREQMELFAKFSSDDDAVHAVKGVLLYLPKLSSKPGPIWSSKIYGAQVDLKPFLQ